MRCLLLTTLLLVTMFPAEPASCAQRTEPVVRRHAAEVLRLALTDLARRSGPRDPEYFRRGTWHNRVPDCWACLQGGPATAAATLWAATGRRDKHLFHLAEATIDRAAARQQSDGAFLPPRADATSTPMTTQFFGADLGMTLLLLHDRLSPGRRTRWASMLARAADYLVAHGDISWYTNGNVNLLQTQLFYLAWRATGEERFRQSYEASWAFVLNPPQAQWPGRGLRLERAPTLPTGADGAGYLSETGVAGTGFDPEYALLQLDVASRLYLVSRDPRALMLANLLANALLPRADRSWMLDTSGGTRHPTQGREVRFMTPGLATLAWDGGRSDLGPRVRGQWSVEEAWFRWAIGDYASAYVYRGLGNNVSVFLLAATPGAL